MRPTRFITAAATALALASSTFFMVLEQAPADVPAVITSVISKPGDSGQKVSEVQGMLFSVGLLRLHQRNGSYDAATTAAVKKFQASKALSQSGVVDDVTYSKLVAAYRARTSPVVQRKTVVRKVISPIPTAKPTPRPVPDVVKYQLDSRCDDEAKVLCADQSRRKVWYLENGKVVKTFDARFGASSTPTRNGSWRIFRKVKDEVSYLYNMVPMPYSMYFSGGEAFHYSADFAQIGWNNSRGGSHGCVNIRDYSGLAWVYNRVPVGTLTIVTR